jgi:hypothetical protein
MSVEKLAKFPGWDSATFHDWIAKVSHFRDALFLPESVWSVDGADFTGSQSAPGNLGLYSDPLWRSFVAATLFADWLAYPAPSDQAELPRLAFVMARFVAGFRVFFATHDGEDVPVGYTGWYPMASSAYARLERSEVDSEERMIVPLRAVPHAERSVYLFNYSIAPSLRKTAASRGMLDRYTADLRRVQAERAAAVTVSQDGARVAARFGLEHRFTFAIGNESENVYLGALKVHPT